MVREDMAQLWSRRRNRKRMDYAKGRAMIGKFEMGQIVQTPGATPSQGDWVLDHDRVLFGHYAFPTLARFIDVKGGTINDARERDKLLYSMLIGIFDKSLIHCGQSLSISCWLTPKHFAFRKSFFVYASLLRSFSGHSLRSTLSEIERLSYCGTRFFCSFVSWLLYFIDTRHNVWLLGRTSRQINRQVSGGIRAE